MSRLNSLNVVMVGLVAATASAGPPATLELDVDGQKVLDIKARSKFEVRPEGIFEVRAIGENQLLLQGLARGSATLVFTPRDGSRKTLAVTVQPMDWEKLAADWEAALGNIPGLTIGFEDRCPWVECATCTDAVRERAQDILLLYPCVKSVHHYGGRRDTMEVLAGVRSLLGEGPDDTPGLVLEVRERTVVLTGEAFTPQDVERIRAVRVEFPEVQVHVKLPRASSPPR